LFGTTSISTATTGDPEKKTTNTPTSTFNLFGNKPNSGETKDSQSTTPAPTGGPPNLFTGFGSSAKPAESASEKDRDKGKSVASKEPASTGKFNDFHHSIQTNILQGTYLAVWVVYQRNLKRQKVRFKDVMIVIF
jgi:hypothetical protein